jgi:integrase
MASISRAADGRCTIQFVDADDKRKSVRLGKVDKRTAQSVKLRVELLLNAKLMNAPVDRDTTAWLTGVGADLAGKLAGVGLIAARDETTLAAFTEAYIQRRTDVKPQTRTNFGIGRQRLIEYFGEDRPLRSITDGDADAWLCWLKGRYAGATAGKTIKWAKQFFRAAARLKLIPSNPFDDVKPPSMVNESRKRFIDRPTIDRVMQACPDAEWRLIVALCRYGGIRCPSELLPLTWADVNWEQNRFFVRSPKTERHEGKDGRWVPIFPEVLPHLETAFERAEPGTVYLINRRLSNQALRSQFQKICKRAGVDLWVKPFHNLRASRETELAASFPLHVVCDWIGNSATIAQKHYLQTTDADFEKATTKSVKDGGALSGAVGAKVVHFPVRTAPDSERQEMTQPLQLQGLCQSESSTGIVRHSVQVTPRGFEPLSRP